MSESGTGLFGSKYFMKAYCIMVDTAGRKETITYDELTGMIDLDYPLGSSREREMGRLLDEISRFEHDHERPMLTAVVVSKEDGKPNSGFFKIAAELGKDTGMKALFWKNELRKVYEEWK